MSQTLTPIPIPSFFLSQKTTTSSPTDSYVCHFCRIVHPAHIAVGGSHRTGPHTLTHTRRPYTRNVGRLRQPRTPLLGVVVVVVMHNPVISSSSLFSTFSFIPSSGNTPRPARFYERSTKSVEKVKKRPCIIAFVSAFLPCPECDFLQLLTPAPRSLQPPPAQV